jgi:hypothetical protein
MKYALVHINEPVLDGFRICEVADNTFEVYKDLTWHEVADDVTAETHYWKDNAPVLLPIPEPKTQPTTSGTQDL